MSKGPDYDGGDRRFDPGQKAGNYFPQSGILENSEFSLFPAKWIFGQRVSGF